jgi:hypothetical protein
MLAKAEATDFVKLFPHKQAASTMAALTPNDQNFHVKVSLTLARFVWLPMSTASWDERWRQGLNQLRLLQFFYKKAFQTL